MVTKEFVLSHRPFFIQYLGNQKNSVPLFMYNRVSKVVADHYDLLRTEVRGDFNIHGTKYFQYAVFLQKSKIHDVVSLLNL